MTDETFMREALAEAAKGEGRTHPNPPVGAVAVCDGAVIGRGHHEFAGGPHAEINALRDAGNCAGATLYVTLEPCSTHGKTPPCTDAIIKAGIGRVVVACEDANPKHRGEGLRILREAGIDVVSGICEAEARKMLAPFFKHVTTGLPYLTLKIAQSLDGAIADHCGVSKWITCAESRAFAKNELRRKCDAVMVGSGTILADDPSLLRPDGSGLRVVLDGRGRVPKSARIFTDGHAAQTLVFADGLQAALRHLGKAGVTHVLCEGGAALVSSIINARMADELFVFIAPVILGADAKRSFGAYPFDLPTAPYHKIAETKQIGTDLLVRLYPE